MPRDDGDDAYAEMAREERARDAKARTERRKKGERVIERFRKRAQGPTSKPKTKRPRNAGDLILARLKKQRENLAKVRDDLRQIAEDATELADNATHAWDSLDDAITKLSEYV